MVAESPVPRTFTFPQLKLERIETAHTELRYMVTMIGQGRRLMIAPKLADLITELQQGKSLEEASVSLSALWGREIGVDSLRLIIEQQMVKQGLAYPMEDGTPPQPVDVRTLAQANKSSLLNRLLTGQFAWRLLKGQHVAKICSPLTIFYERFSVALALVFIVATRWALYSTMDGHFLQQTLTQFNAAEYLANLGLLLVVILIHEFGHAAAQLKFGVPTGGIGVQLHYYIPAFFTNVSASWALKPSRRVVVDMGGVYFQGLAASILYLIYLQTGSLAFLTAIVISDVLCLISLNPFLRFDGYWLLSDVLAVPNLQKHSSETLRYFWKSLTGRATEGNTLLLSKWRMVALAGYAILKNCFWVLLVAGIIFKAHLLVKLAGATFAKFGSQVLKGWQTTDGRLVFASLLQMLIFILLLLTLSVMVGKLISKLYGFIRGAAMGIFVRLQPSKDCTPQGMPD